MFQVQLSVATAEGESIRFVAEKMGQVCLRELTIESCWSRGVVIRMLTVTVGSPQSVSLLLVPHRKGMIFGNVVQNSDKGKDVGVIETSFLVFPFAYDAVDSLAN